jgi:DNA-binding transcriptional MerR regulator
MSTTLKADSTYSFIEVASHLQVTTETLRAWNRRFGQYLAADVNGDPPRYTSSDVAALLTVQKLLEQGFSDEQVGQRLMPRRIDTTPTTAVSLPPQQARSLAQKSSVELPLVLGDVLSTIANGQQTVINSQSTLREMVSVVVQDNFNLKDENRKLRDRMLELERAFAEYQRREETRKERMESRMRAIEGTVAALQQQVAQMAQMQRSQPKKRGWW